MSFGHSFFSVHSRTQTNFCIFPSLQAPGTRTGWE
jgi:hypothetical protein